MAAAGIASVTGHASWGPPRRLARQSQDPGPGAEGTAGEVGAVAIGNSGSAAGCGQLCGEMHPSMVHRMTVAAADGASYPGCLPVATRPVTSPLVAFLWSVSTCTVTPAPFPCRMPRAMVYG